MYCLFKAGEGDERYFILIIIIKYRSDRQARPLDRLGSNTHIVSYRIKQFYLAAYTNNIHMCYVINSNIRNGSFSPFLMFAKTQTFHQLTSVKSRGIYR